MLKAAAGADSWLVIGHSIQKLQALTFAVHEFVCHQLKPFKQVGKQQIALGTNIQVSVHNLCYVI